MKRYLVLIAMSLMIMANLSAKTEEVASGKCGDNLNWTLSSDSILTVSGEGDMWDFFSTTNLEAPWTKVSEKIKKVVFEEGVTSIGDEAFISMGAVKEIELPATMEKIGTYSLSETGIEQLTLGANIKTVGSGAFADCKSLRTLKIANGKTILEDMAFSCCDSLENVTMPEELSITDPTTFQSTKWFDSKKGEIYIGSSLCGYGGEMPANYTLNVKEGTKLICRYSLEAKNNLVKIVVPASVEKIDNMAFFGCESLAEAEIPAGTDIGDGVFDGTPFIKTLQGQTGMRYVGTACYGYKADVTEEPKTLTVREGTKWIKPYAFNAMHKLEKIELPNTIEVIGEKAFKECVSLNTVVLPDSLRKIGTQAFYKCGLKTVNLPEKIVTINDEAFYGCAQLETLVPAPEFAPVYIAHNAFGMTKWWEAQQTSGVIYIGKMLFACSSMPDSTSVRVKEGTKTINSDAFVVQLGIKEIILPNTVENVAYSAFSNCGAERIKLSSGVKYYDGSAFSGCSKLRALDLPEGVEGIHGHINGLDSLKRITLPSTLTLFGLLIFEPIMPDTVIMNFGERTLLMRGMSSTLAQIPNLKYFRGPAKAMETEYPLDPNGGYEVYTDKLETAILTTGTIDTTTLRFTDVSKKALKTLDIEACGNKTLGESWFEGYEALQTLRLPAEVEEIGDKCFAGCTKIDTIRVLNSVPPTITGKTFEGVRDSIVLQVPQNAIEAYKAHEHWKRFLPEGVVTEVEETLTSEITVWGYDGTLHVENMPVEGYEVYDLTGRRLYKGSDETVALGRGIYIIKAREKSIKTAL